MKYRNVEHQTKDLHLSLNLTKSNAIIISRSSSPTDLKLSIPVENSSKILGMIINGRLHWDSHINYVIKKASQRLHILRRLKHLVTRHENHNVYVAVVRSLLEYACPVFVGLNKSLAKKLQKLDNRAHRIIFGNDRQDWLCCCTTLLDRRIQLSTNLLHHIQKHPNHTLSNRVPHTLQFSGRYCIPFCRTEKRKASFFPFIVTHANGQTS